MRVLPTRALGTLVLLLLPALQIHAQDDVTAKALAMKRAGDLNGAKSALQSILADDDDNARAHYILGWVLIKQGQRDDAKAQFEKMVTLGGDPTDTAEAAGALLRLSGVNMAVPKNAEEAMAMASEAAGQLAEAMGQAPGAAPDMPAEAAPPGAEPGPPAEDAGFPPGDEPGMGGPPPGGEPGMGGGMPGPEGAMPAGDMGLPPAGDGAAQGGGKKGPPIALLAGVALAVVLLIVIVAVLKKKGGGGEGEAVSDDDLSL